jgi:hypothetical protein
LIGPPRSGHHPGDHPLHRAGHHREGDQSHLRRLQTAKVGRVPGAVAQPVRAGPGADYVDRYPPLYYLVVGLPSLVTTSGWVLLWIIGAGRYVLPIMIGVPILAGYTLATPGGIGSSGSVKSYCAWPRRSASRRRTGSRIRAGCLATAPAWSTRSRGVMRHGPRSCPLRWRSRSTPFWRRPCSSGWPACSGHRRTRRLNPAQSPRRPEAHQRARPRLLC